MTDKQDNRREWHGKTRGGAFGYAFFIYSIKYLGLGFAYGFLVFVIMHFAIFAPKASYHTYRYARRILKKSRLASLCFILKNYYRFGQTIIDKMAINGGLKDKFRFEFANYQPFLDVLDADTGCIMLGAHVGNWEIGAPFFDRYGKNINIVMYDAEYQKIKELIERETNAKNYKVIPVEQDGIAHVFKITEALSRHEYVCFQGDRYFNSEKINKVDFMGRPADFPAGPFLLASRMNVPVVFYFAMRERHKTYRFHFVIADSNPPKGMRKEAYLLAQYTAALGENMKRYPEQWFNYYNFWKLS